MTLTKPDRGWAWVVLGASFGAMVVNGSLGQGIGIVHLALLENFNEDNTRTSLAGSLFVATQSCGGVFAGLVLKKYSCRVATIAGSLVMTAGFVCCAFLDSLDLIILVYGGIVVLTGAAPLQGAFLISISGAYSMVARILTGLATSGNEVDVALVLIGTVSVLGISTICFPLYGHHYEGQVLYAVFFGLYNGNCYPLLNGLSLRLVGLRHLAMAVSIEMFSVGLGLLSGPPCAGLFFDNGGTYDQCFIITGFFILIGAMFTLVSEFFRTRRGSSDIPRDSV